MTVTILGTECPTCQTLEANTEKALEQVSLDVSLEKIEDMEEIMSYGVMSMPALVVDGDVKVSGRVPDPDEITALVEE
ncbi:MAG: thioredoxin family protein [Salinibacter sp.]